MEQKGGREGVKGLIDRGPNPSRGLTSLVLREYPDILEARSLGWGWAEIAEALGRPGAGKRVAKAFHATQARVQRGVLKPPSRRRSGAQETTNASAFKGFTEL